MKVELEKTFALPGSADVAWEFLQNIEAVAGCMPGAAITERQPGGGFKGTVTVRVGPATMSFRGEVDVRDIDHAARSLVLLGKGTDTTGTSGASMDLAARIEAAGNDASTLVGRSEVTMSGKAAAFGGRMMNSVADQVLKQFAQNFATQVAALAVQRKSSVAAPVVVTAPEQRTDDPGASTARPASTAMPSPAARELDGLGLIWAVFKDWLRGLFRGRSA